MIFDLAEVQLLRLVAQCRELPCENAFAGTWFLGQENLGLLLEQGLLYLSKNGKRYRVTPLGYDLLTRMGYSNYNEKYKETDEEVLSRRDNAA